MYKITIQTLNGNEKTLYYPGNDEFAVMSADLSLKVGNAGEFNFTVPQSNPLYNEIVDRSIITIYEDNTEIWRGDIRDISQNFDKSLEVYALEDLAWLGDETVPMVAVENQTYAQRFSAVMANYNENQPAKRQFQPGIITSVTTSNFCNWQPLYEETLLECIRRCIADNGYLKARRVTNNGTVTRYIDILLLEDYGQQAQQAIRFGSNLLDFVKEIDNTNFLNVLYPYGKETEEKLYGDVMRRIEGTPIQNDASIAAFGRHSRTVIFETDSMANLNRLALAYLNRYSQPSLKIKAKAIDLGNIEDISRMHLGDSVRIIAEPFAIDQWDYITNQELDLLNIANNQIELSNAVRVSTLTSQVASQGEEIKDTRTPASVLDEAKRNAWAIFEGDNGGIVTFNVNGNQQIVGIHIANNLDLSQATKAWGWNVNGLVYLHRDYPSDEWQIGIAMTMNGEIVADYITTGSLTADIIDTGTFIVGGSNQYHQPSILVKNENGITIGSWTKNGINITGGQINISGYAKNSDIPDVSGFATKTGLAQEGYTIIDAGNITTGEMVANRIKGGTLTLGGSNNDNGLFEVKNASDITVVRGNSDGLYAIAGQIGGAYLTSDEIYRLGTIVLTDTFRMRMPKSSTWTDYSIISPFRPNKLFLKATSFKITVDWAWADSNNKRNFFIYLWYYSSGWQVSDYTLIDSSSGNSGSYTFPVDIYTSDTKKWKVTAQGSGSASTVVYVDFKAYVQNTRVVSITDGYWGEFNGTFQGTASLQGASNWLGFKVIDDGWLRYFVDDKLVDISPDTIELKDGTSYGRAYISFASTPRIQLRKSGTSSYPQIDIYASSTQPSLTVNTSSTKYISLADGEIEIQEDSDNWVVINNVKLTAHRGSTSKYIDWTSGSDRRVKKDINPLDIDLSKNLINATEVFSFKYISEEDKHYGVIAQDMRKLLDSLGETDAYLEHSMGIPEEKADMVDQRAVAYTEFIPHLINYVKDLRAEITVLKEEVRILKEEKNDGKH